MEIEWIIFIILIILSLVGYYRSFSFNKCGLIILSNLLFILYGIVMGIVSKN
jgi:hypothetical protein